MGSTLSTPVYQPPTPNMDSIRSIPSTSAQSIYNNTLPTAPSLMENSSPNTENIESENLRCVICLSEPETPSICPKCSKLFCRSCITEWFSHQYNSSCPNCRQGIRLNELVTIRWFDDVMALQKMSSISRDTDVPLVVEGEDICSAHGRMYELFCIDCQICLCNLCMTNSVHESHVFQKMSTICRSKTTILIEGMAKVREYVEKTTILENNMQANLNEMEQQRNEVVKKLQDLMGAEITRLDQLYNEKQKIVSGQRTEVAKLINNINRSIHEDEANIWACSKSEFLKKYTSTIKKYENFLAVPILKFEKQTINLESDFLSTQKINMLTVSRSLVQPAIVKFNDELGSKWKFVFSRVGNFLSSSYEAQFIMENGLFNVLYQCNLTMKHPTNSSRNIVANNERIPFTTDVACLSLKIHERDMEIDRFFQNGMVSINIEFYVRPVNKMSCLKKLNELQIEERQCNQDMLSKIKMENKNSQDKFEKLNKSFKESMASKAKLTKENQELKAKLKKEIKLSDDYSLLVTKYSKENEKLKTKLAIKKPDQPIPCASKSDEVKLTKEDGEFKGNLVKEKSDQSIPCAGNQQTIIKIDSESNEKSVSPISNVQNKSKKIIATYPVVYIELTRSSNDIYKWISSINDTNGFTWQIKLQLYPQRSKITYFITLLKGNGDVPYLISVAHPPGQKIKFDDYQIKSPVSDKASVELCPKKGLGFAIGHMDTIIVAIKIGPKG